MSNLPKKYHKNPFCKFHYGSIQFDFCERTSFILPSALVTPPPAPVPRPPNHPHLPSLPHLTSSHPARPRSCKVQKWKRNLCLLSALQCSYLMKSRNRVLAKVIMTIITKPSLTSKKDVDPIFDSPVDLENGFKDEVRICIAYYFL